MNKDKVLEHFYKVTQEPGVSDRYMALCPAHNDHVPSLSIYFDPKSDKTLLKCHAGCSFEAICTAAGIKKSDLFKSNENTKSFDNFVAIYDYENENGKSAYQVCRTIDKTFPVRHTGADGKWIFNMNGVSPIPYKLPQIITARDNGQPLFIVEGEKDVNTLCSYGLTATTRRGGCKSALAPSEFEPLFGLNEVIILPDYYVKGDTYGKNWAKALEDHVESIKIIDLKLIWPEIPDNGDITDYLEWYHSTEIDHDKTRLPGILLKLIEDTPVYTSEKPNVSYPTEIITNTQVAIDKVMWLYESISWPKQQFAVHNNRLSILIDVIFQPLCNGIIWVSKKYTVTDSGNTRSYYDVEGITDNGIILRTIRVPSGDLDSLIWFENEWLSQITPIPDYNSKKLLAYALKMSAGKVDTAYMCDYVGWHEDSDNIVFVTSNEAIGSKKMNITLAEENDRQSAYRLDSVGCTKTDAIDACLSLIDTHSRDVTIPLLSLFFLAPLIYFARTKCKLYPSFTVILVGATESGKSTLAANFMNLFGTFTKQEPTANFSGTLNSILHMLGMFHDVVCWIDDLYPPKNNADTLKQIDLLQAVVRAVSDGSDRSRLTKDLNLRKVERAGCIPLITAEALPGISSSGISRLFPIEIEKPEKYADLNHIQSCINSGVLRNAMRYYICNLLENIENVPQMISTTYKDMLDIAVHSDSKGGRLNEAQAWMMLGGHFFVKFACSTGRFNRNEENDFRQEVIDTISKAANKQYDRFAESDPVNIFLEGMEALINLKGYFVAIGEAETDNTIGWFDDEIYYFMFKPTFGAVNRLLNKQNITFPLPPNTLMAHMKKLNMLIPDSYGKYARHKRVKSKNPNVFYMSKSIIDDRVI